MKSVKSSKYIKNMKNTLAVFLSVIFLCLSPFSGIGGISALLTVSAAETNYIKTDDVLTQYQEYRKRLDSIEYRADISENGYKIVEDQVFPIEIYGYGEDEVFLIPAYDEKYNRLGFFLKEAEEKFF